MRKIYPVILAGGSGTRLWPISRKEYPKQFSKIQGNRSLFQDTATRLTTSQHIEFFPPLILTNSDYRYIVCDQLHQIDIEPGPVLIEPEAKNTAGAILAASLYAGSKDNDAILLVSPSDHILPNMLDFHHAISDGLSCLDNGNIVTFGIAPTKPETGYGYLELQSEALTAGEASAVLKFVEKPSEDLALQMLESGNFLWNSGIYLFKASDMVSAFKKYAPDMFDLVTTSIKCASEDLGFLRLQKSAWSKLENTSIDYAIMEKSNNLVAIKYCSKWSDLGSWDAVWLESDKDINGNVVSNECYTNDCIDSLVRSEGNSQTVVALGLKDLIVVSMNDAVLVAEKGRSQELKDALHHLQKDNVDAVGQLPTQYRFWGFKELIASGDLFEVNNVCIKPKCSLTLHKHRQRSEHWVVVKGTAIILIDDTETSLSAGQSVYAPSNSIHKIENSGENDLILIEVKTGPSICNDDLTD